MSGTIKIDRTTEAPVLGVRYGRLTLAKAAQP